MQYVPHLPIAARTAVPLLDALDALVTPALPHRRLQLDHQLCGQQRVALSHAVDHRHVDARLCVEQMVVVVELVQHVLCGSGRQQRVAGGRLLPPLRRYLLITALPAPVRLDADGSAELIDGSSSRERGGRCTLDLSSSVRKGEVKGAQTGSSAEVLVVEAVAAAVAIVALPPTAKRDGEAASEQKDMTAVSAMCKNERRRGFVLRACIVYHVARRIPSRQLAWLIAQPLHYRPNAEKERDALGSTHRTSV